MTIFLVCCFLGACNSTKNTTGTVKTSSLEGNWDLFFISEPAIAFDRLYPNQKPTLSFDLSNNRVNGYSGCNRFNGALKIDGNKLSFTEPMAMTRMACLDGNGETIFMETLNKITDYSLTNAGRTLNLNIGNVAMMKFTKQ